MLDAISFIFDVTNYHLEINFLVGFLVRVFWSELAISLLQLWKHLANVVLTWSSTLMCFDVLWQNWNNNCETANWQMFLFTSICFLRLSRYFCALELPSFRCSETGISRASRLSHLTSAAVKNFPYFIFNLKS